MNKDDSFNDSDDIFDLYSTKKVTERFKAQFEKLISDDGYLKDKTKKNECIQVSDTELNDSLNGIAPQETVEDVEIIECDQPVSNNLRSKRKKKSESMVRPRQRRGRKKKRKIEEIDLLDSPKSLADEEAEKDDLNPEVSVKVIWKSVAIKKYTIRKFQKLSKIFELLSEEEKVPEENIVLLFNNERVNYNDTPDSLNLHVYHFLDGGVVDEGSNNLDASLKLTSDCLTLRFQDANKKIIKINLKPDEKMKVGMIKYSEQLEIDLDKIKFFFDGELLKPSETPASLGIYNDELIDVKICN